jgi:8-oxo-dGTP pyrophosphatase MutT (NUDIX family)
MNRDARVTLLEQALSSLSPIDEREATSLEALRHLLATREDDVFSETGNDHHVTASALVVSSRGVILHRHKRLGIWVQPGGHVDPKEWPDVAAIRETSEETGLLVRHPGEPWLIHVDVHPGPRGHTHYDLRYLLVSDGADPVPPVDESPDVHWFSLDEAPSQAVDTMDGALRRLRADDVTACVAKWCP